MDLSLFVRPGQRITAALWNKLVAACRGARILAGDGISLRQTPDGTMISCSTWRPWNHPFKVSMSGTSATISRGLISEIEPTIHDAPIGGTEKSGPPKLEFKEPKLDEDDRGWIAVEILCEQKEWKIESATVVQVDSLETDDPARARHPLAMIRKQASGSLSLFQIEYFNLQHRAEVRENAKARHFFWPA